MFSRSPESSKAPREAAVATVMAPGEMAIDTLAATLRTFAEFPLEQEKMETATFTELAEKWAQHVVMATTPPNGQPLEGAGKDGRRDWTGVREFVRDYCKGSSHHTHTVISDLRQMVWVFIQSLSRAFATDREVDGRLLQQFARLEKLTQTGATGDLKREVLATVVEVSQALEERRERQQEQMEHLGAQIKTLGTELESAKRDSETDPLTKLYNRKAFDEHLQKSLQLYRAFGQPSCLMIIDVDRFKTVNDTLGHVVGDEVLRKVADAVTRVFLRKTDFVARYGGDEVAVVLHDTTLADAQGLAERALKSARAVGYEKDDIKFNVSISVGLAAVAPGFDETTWIDAADQALLRAKQAGRDRIGTAGEPPSP